MAKKSHAEFLIQKDPRLLELSKYYESVEQAEPVLWAQAELKGEPTVATAALAYALRKELTDPADHSWINSILTGNVNIDSEEVTSAAAEALRKLGELNVPLELLTPVVRSIQAQILNNIAGLLEEGPTICCIPMPAGRESHWQLFATDSEEQPTEPILEIAHLVRI